MVSKYFTVRLICKTKFPDTCHALKNTSAVKGLIVRLCLSTNDFKYSLHLKVLQFV